jgi:hypothetical protein
MASTQSGFVGSKCAFGIHTIPPLSMGVLLDISPLEGDLDKGIPYPLFFLYYA